MIELVIKQNGGYLMEKLSYKNFIKTRDYIFAHANDINQAWFRYNFETEDTVIFMNELAKYQYEDGGFGRLVPEYEYDGSTLHDTEHAFRYIFYLKEKPPANHPVIQKMMHYLLNRYRPEIGCWGEEMEPGVNDGIHVSWWTYGKHQYPEITDINERIKQYNANGNAAHAAFIALYSEIIPAELYRDIIFYPIENILRYYDENSPLFENPDDAPYGLHCYQKFVSCLKDKTLAEKLASILCQHPTACMEINFDKWENEYIHLPCDVVETPDSVIYPVVKDLVDKSLNYLIKHQGSDGAWHLNYSFGGDEAFRKLEKSYETYITTLYLAKLKRFGRIEI